MLDLKAVAQDFETFERRLARRGEKAAQTLAPVRPLAQRRRELNVLIEKQKKLGGRAQELIGDGLPLGRDLIKTSPDKALNGKYCIFRVNRRLPLCRLPHQPGNHYITPEPLALRGFSRGQVHRNGSAMR